MKKSELRKIIKQTINEIKEQGPRPQGGDAGLCAAYRELERNLNASPTPHTWDLWKRFKHALRHIWNGGSCDGGSGPGPELDCPPFCSDSDMGL